MSCLVGVLVFGGVFLYIVYRASEEDRKYLIDINTP